MELLYENRQWWSERERKPEVFVPHGTYRDISEFPFVVRDITLPISSNNLLDLVSKGGKYLEKVFKIGEYLPKNNESFRLIFQSKHRTLSKEEVDEVMKAYDRRS